MMMLVETIGYAQEVFGRPEMDIDSFGRSRIGVPEASADELDRDAFDVQFRCEIMPQRMRSESRYPGVPGKFFTEAVQTAS